MSKKQPPFLVEQRKQSMFLITEYTPRDDWEYKVLLQFDRHWDNAGTDRAMIKRHLDEAVAINAPVVDGGDFFCAMQGKYDRRSSKSACLPEHQVSNYLDALVDTGTGFLAPYAKQIAWMAPGNHELSIKDRHETDLTDRLTANLRGMGSQVLRHNISGFTKFQFKQKDGGSSKSKVMWHHHGYGGGGPVTKDVIQTARQSDFLDGVDIVCSGHTHDAWSFTRTKVGMTVYGDIKRKEVLFVKVPSAKDKFGKESWEDLRGMPPKPLGSYWLRFRYSAKIQGIYVDVERAF